MFLKHSVFATWWNITLQAECSSFLHALVGDYLNIYTFIYDIRYCLNYPTAFLAWTHFDLNLICHNFVQVTQVLVLTVMATLVKYTTNESEVRILYEYLAEASIVFPKVFPVIHSLLVSLLLHFLPCLNTCKSEVEVGDRSNPKSVKNQS